MDDRLNEVIARARSPVAVGTSQQAYDQACKDLTFLADLIQKIFENGKFSPDCWLDVQVLALRCSYDILEHDFELIQGQRDSLQARVTELERADDNG